MNKNEIIMEDVSLGDKIVASFPIVEQEEVRKIIGIIYNNNNNNNNNNI